MKKLITLMLCIALLGNVANATNYVVDTNGDGAAPTAPSYNLRSAITAANADASTPHTISFSGVSSAITLGSALPAITKTMTIDGGAGVTINGFAGSSILTVNSSITVTLNYLTLQNASGSIAGGAAIQSSGNLTLNHCNIQNNANTNPSNCPGIQCITASTTININDCVIQNNSGTKAAINVGNTTTVPTLNIKNCIISGNTNNSSGSYGGGISSIAATTITNTVISGNSAPRGGGICLGNGASTSKSSLSMTGCTISGNSLTTNATSAYGGGIYIQGAASALTDNCFFTNCTISGNSTPALVAPTTASTSGGVNIGGGASAGSTWGPTITFNNCTITGNTVLGNPTSSTNLGGGIDKASNGTPIIILNYCLVAGNNSNSTNASRDINVTAASLGSSTGRNLYNGSVTFSYSGAVITGNVASSAAITTILNTTLTDNGGTNTGTNAALPDGSHVQTHALVSGSPAINPTNAGSGTQSTDQRGYSRDQLPDIGSYEFITTVTNNSDAGAGSLRQAITDANANSTNTSASAPYIINVSGSYAITLASALPAIACNLSINANASNTLTVNGFADNSILSINSGKTVTLNYMTLQNASGNITTGSALNNSGNLTLNNCTVQNNSNSSTGSPGIYCATASTTININNSIIQNNSGAKAAISIGNITTVPTLNLTNCIVKGNINSSSTSFGGGIYSTAITAITNTIISGNSAPRGGGICLAYGNATTKSSLSMTSCTVNGNSLTTNAASAWGGGIYIQGTITGDYTGNCSFTNCTISGNSTPAIGGSTTASVGGGVNIGWGGNSSWLSTSTFNNCTITGNTVLGNPSNSTNVGGGIDRAYGTVILNYCIVAGNNSNSTNASRDINVTAASLGSSTGNNLFNGSATFSYTGAVTAGNIASSADISAILNPTLADNGGTTALPDGTYIKTHALVSGSPALNPARSSSGYQSVDERGTTRKATPDMGAFESAFATVTPTISFPTLATKYYGNSVFTNALTTNSDGTITYSSSNPSVATVNSSTGQVTIKSVGTTVITASQAVSSTYNSATLTYSLPIVAHSLSITANDVHKTYGTSALSDVTGSTAFSSSGLGYGETIGSVNITYATGTGSGNDPADAVGTYTSNVTSSAASGGTFTASNYNITYNTGSIIVDNAQLTVNSPLVTSKVYDGGNTATITGSLSGVYNSDDVSLNGTGTFASLDVANGISVTSTSTLGGTKAGNYSLIQPTGLTGNITAIATPISSDGSIGTDPLLPGTDITVNSGFELTVDNSSPTTVHSITVNPGGKLTVASGKSLTVLGVLTLHSSLSGQATLVDLNPTGGLTVNGATNVEQYLSKSRNWYVSSPVSLATASVVNPQNSPNLLYWYDETKGAPAGWTPITSNSSSLTPGLGYIVHPAADAVTLNYTGGHVNTGTTPSFSVNRTSEAPDHAGFNLIGNPYPSYLNAVTVVNSSLNLDKSIWYRTQKNNTSTYYFDTYNTLGKQGTNNSANVAHISGTVAPMQAFWVHVSNGQSSAAINFDNSYRTHANADTLNPLKVKSQVAQASLHLQVSNGVNSDETLIYSDPNASNGYDMYDSQKMSNVNASIPELYTLAGTEPLAINGMNTIPYDSEIVLGFSTLAPGSFSIKASQFSNFTSGTQIIVKDNLLNAQQDLTVGDYSFTSTATSNNTSRFSLLFHAPSVATGINPDSNNNVWITTLNGQIVVNGSTNRATLEIFNAIGQKVISRNVSGINIHENNNLPVGAYLVKVTNEGKSITKKIIID